MGEVHLWHIDLDAASKNLAALGSTLSPEECERAKRFRSPDLSRRWTVARGALRCILASYCQSPPKSLVLQAEPKGKPKLVWPATNVCFNLSHSGGLALLAITVDQRIGVDLEIVNPSIEVADLSRRFFAPAEARQILVLPAEELAVAFFRCWTRKEALLKAIGLGLSAPLDGFEVTVGADPARLVSADFVEPGEWSLVDVSWPGTAAALAIEGRPPAVRHFRFEEHPKALS